MDTQKAQELLAKQQQGTLTPEERAILDSWYIQLAKSEGDVPQADLAKKQEAVYDRISKTLNTGKTIRLWPRIAVAASGCYCYYQQAATSCSKPKQPQQQIAQNQKRDIAPGGNKAILTLANGQKIVLTGAKNGLVAMQGNMAVQKTVDGKLIYQPGANSDSQNSAAALSYNTLTIPKGGQSWLTLADGTRVLLNADTKLTYPTAFTGKTREVTLNGEAYFEVAHNDKQPFKVITKGQIVQDIGTHFNINAYDDEPAVRTTLLEGSVKVTHNAQSEILKPGQQAVLKADALQVSEVNTEAAIAWKNGYFMFDSENIQSIMRKVSRWYNVTIEYQGDIPVTGFQWEYVPF